MSYEDRTLEYYRNTLETSYTHWGKVGWGSVDGQHQRIRLLANIAHQAVPKLFGYSLLDVGCGLGEATGYWRGVYCGIDLVPEMIEQAKANYDHWPDTKFEVRDIIDQPFDRKFDAVIASGIFALHCERGRYVADMIKAMWEHCTKVCAFNMLSTSSNDREEGEAYFHMQDIVGFCSTLTPYVKLDHTYRQNDFTIAMYREPQTI